MQALGQLTPANVGCPDLATADLVEPPATQAPTPGPASVGDARGIVDGPPDPDFHLFFERTADGGYTLQWRPPTVNTLAQFALVNDMDDDLDPAELDELQKLFAPPPTTASIMQPASDMTQFGRYLTIPPNHRL